MTREKKRFLQTVQHRTSRAAVLATAYGAHPDLHCDGGEFALPSGDGVPSSGLVEIRGIGAAA